MQSMYTKIDNIGEYASLIATIVELAENYLNSHKTLMNVNWKVDSQQ